MPEIHRPSKFVTDMVYPVLERTVDLIFMSSALLVFFALIALIYGLARASMVIIFIASGMFIAAVVGIYARFIAPYRLQIKHITFSPHSQYRPAQGFKIVFFSDLHVGRYKQTNWTRRVVETINQLNPDLILYGGDFYGHPPKQLKLADLLAPLGNLGAPYGVYSVLGNHDHGLHDSVGRKDELLSVLSNLSIRVLHNETVCVTPWLRLVGVAELWVQDDDVDMAFEPNPACPPHANEWVLCLGHNPDLMQKIRHRADLFVFGHTHAGQIYLPFAPGLAVPIRSKLYRGMHLLRQGMVYISSGCGEASTPTRLGTLPEVVVITADTMST